MKAFVAILLVLTLIACTAQAPPGPTPAATPPAAEPPSGPPDFTPPPVSPPETTPPTTTPPTETKPPVTAPTVEITMTAQRFSFTPNTITVKQGSRVIIHLTSTDARHGLSIQGYDASVIVERGDTKTLEFVADKAGTFTFFCNSYCGSGHTGMTGQLVVQ